MLRALPLLLVLVCAAAPGQKPRPIEIPVRDGAGMIQGRLKASRQIDYEVAASGRALTLTINATPMRTLQVRVFGPDGAPLPIQRESPGHWTVATPQPGRYKITVMRTSRSAPASRFTLRVAVE